MKVVYELVVGETPIKKWELDTSKVPASEAYLTQYGYKQSMADVLAGREKAIRKANATKSESDQLAAVKKDLIERLDARQKKFTDNTPPALGSRSNPLERLAAEQVETSLRSKGLWTTTDDDKFEALVAHRVATRGKQLAAELARRAKVDDVEVEITPEKEPA